MNYVYIDLEYGGTSTPSTVTSMIILTAWGSVSLVNACGIHLNSSMCLRAVCFFETRLWECLCSFVSTKAGLFWYVWIFFCLLFVCLRQLARNLDSPQIHCDTEVLSSCLPFPIAGIVDVWDYRSNTASLWHRLHVFYFISHLTAGVFFLSFSVVVVVWLFGLVLIWCFETQSH